MVGLVDAHVHLQMDAFAGRVGEVVGAARAAGVAGFVCNGTRPGDWAAVAALAREHAGVQPCFGVHPWFVGETAGDWLGRLEGLLKDWPGAAVGEIGLDRWIVPREEALQERVFRAQLGLARRLGRPVVVHCLRAWDWLLEVLESEAGLPGLMIHACGAAPDTVKALLARGAYISYAGNVLEEKRAAQREALKSVPVDRLLVESDAPDMLPPAAYRRGVYVDAGGVEHNWPAHLAATAVGIAALRGVGLAELAKRTTENMRRLLG